MSEKSESLEGQIRIIKANTFKATISIGEGGVECDLRGKEARILKEYSIFCDVEVLVGGRPVIFKHLKTSTHTKPLSDEPEMSLAPNP